MDVQISPLKFDAGINSLTNGIWLEPSAHRSFDAHRFAVLQGRLLPLDDFVPWHLDATAWVSGVDSDDPRYETLDRPLDTYRKERRALSLTAAETDLVRYSVKPGCIEADVEQWLLFHLRAVYDIYEAYRPKGTRKALEEIFGIAKSGPRADIAGQGFVDFCQLAFKTRTMLDLRGDGQVAPDPTGTEENAGSLASNDDDGDDGDEDDDARTVTPRWCHCHRGGDENSADEDDDDDQEAEMGRGFVDFFQLASNARAMLGPR
ncbi:uncharacterized protein PFL1_05982 [Pseudozyma flocculosa PF-1]|nr:uncharacterized protein PFL1_05982 [Pseudozyma flocculosa PF-1]EPQ26333.1 hypothetical protein PFL1_05982 [Pseudozyma flocculosa PF-1]